MWAKILLLFFIFSFLFRTDHSFDQDLGRHLKLGEIISQTGSVPKTNLFSYTNPDFPFINTHWLFEVFVYFWSITLGLNSLLILKIIIFLFSTWLIFKIIPKKNQILLLPIAFIFLHVLRERLELRPEIFSFLFTASTYYILETSLRAPKGRGNLLFLLPLIQLIWINTHIYFFVGLTLQAIYLLYYGYESLRFNLKGWNIKLLGTIFALSVTVCFINPNGLAGILYPLNVTKNYGYTIVENQTMFLLESIGFKDPNFLFVKLTGGIILVSILFALLSFLRRQESNQIKNIFLTIAGLGLALLNVRSFPYLVFLSLPAVLQNFGEIKKNWFTKFLLFITCALLFLESFFYLNGDYYRYTESQQKVGLKLIESGKEALDFVISNNLPSPIFNNFDIGSYIIYRGFPKYKVFVDGRPEAYPKEFFTNTYIPTQYDYNKFKILDSQMSFKTVIFSHTDQTPWGINFLQNIVKDSDWSIVYIDNFIIVLVKKKVAEENKLTVIELNKLDPADFKFEGHVDYLKLGIFLLRNQNQNGVNFIQKAAEIFPNSPVVTQTPSLFFW